MTWIKYLLEANLYLVLFYAVYYLLLRRETYYQLNRFYLLFTPLLAFAIPKLELGFLKPAPIMIEQLTMPITPVIITSYTPITNTLPQNIPAEPANYYLLAYIGIAIIMAVVLLIRIYQLTKLARKGKHTVANRVNLIELDEDEHAFSFFNYLFISKKMASSSTIIRHELVHIQQKHSFDVIYMELIKIICWFNPIIYLMQNSVKELHEFIADSKIAATNHDVNYYTDFLISNAYGLPETNIANTFFTKNLLKKRIMMLHQKRSGVLARLKYLVAIPLMAGMLCLSTLGFAKDYPVYDLLPTLPLKAAAKPKIVSDHQKRKLPPTKAGVVVSNLTTEAGTDSAGKKFAASGISYRGLVDQKTKTTIRTIDSLFGKFSPLYVIDGVILTSQNAAKLGYVIKKDESIISAIPQEDIVSMEILKDKSAVELYGAKGYNGVIIVTTKNGKGKRSATPGHHPLIYVDDKPFEYKDSDLGFDDNGGAKGPMSLIPQETIAAMHVYNAKDAVETFGPAGADGVIFITTIQGQAKSEPLTVAAKKDSVDRTLLNDFYSYFEYAVRYPKVAGENNIQGKVFVTFNVNEDNTVTNYKILRGLSTETDAEVIRVLKGWKAPAGLSKDRNFTVPISFTLKTDDSDAAQPAPSKYVETNTYVPNNFKSYVLKEIAVRGYFKRVKQ